MTGRPDSGGQQGVRLLLVLMLLGGGFVGLQHLAYVSLVQKGPSGVRSTAETLARERVARIREASAGSLDSLCLEEPYGSVPGYPAFRRVTTIAEDPRAPTLRRAMVRVYWSEDRCSVTTDVLLPLNGRQEPAQQVRGPG